MTSRRWRQYIRHPERNNSCQQKKKNRRRSRDLRRGGHRPGRLLRRPRGEKWARALRHGLRRQRTPSHERRRPRRRELSAHRMWRRPTKGRPPRQKGRKRNKRFLNKIVYETQWFSQQHKENGNKYHLGHFLIWIDVLPIFGINVATTLPGHFVGEQVRIVVQYGQFCIKPVLQVCDY